MPVAFAPVRAGRFTARHESVDGDRVVLVTGESGQPMAMIASRLVDAPEAPGPRIAIGQVSRPGGGRRLAGMAISAAGGSWFLPEPATGTAFRTPVLDPAGGPVATVRHRPGAQDIVLPGGTLTMLIARFRPQYRLHGMYAADRTVRHAVVPDLAAQVFGGEVLPPLAAAPDASLVFALVTLFTWRAIRQKAEDEAWRTSR